MELEERLFTFLMNNVIPAEEEYDKYVAKNPWKIPPILEQLKSKAKSAGLWNLFVSFDFLEFKGHQVISNEAYCKLAEYMGYSHIAPEVFNCSAPDTGNMEVLAKYGNAEQRKTYLEPLLAGEIRSAFAMTEPGVSSSDATQIATSIADLDDEHYVINGRKWWITGAGDPRCKVYLLFGKHSRKINVGGLKESHSQHSVILIPANSPGIKIVRPMTVFGYDDSPVGHCEIIFDSVIVPRKNVILGEGRGFEIAQSRLGPGRLHHCMRAIGMAERALRILIRRASTRTAFGKTLISMGSNKELIASLRIDINLARLSVTEAARIIDKKGLKAAIAHISIAKVVVPKMLLRVIDSAIQIHGAAGLSEDFQLARMYSSARTLRFADGVDDVHLNTISKIELSNQKMTRANL